jgi:hypothetical protein
MKKYKKYQNIFRGVKYMDWKDITKEDVLEAIKKFEKEKPDYENQISNM